MASKKKRRRCDDAQEGKKLCNERNQQERLLASGIVDNFPISNRAFASFFLLLAERKKAQRKRSDHSTITKNSFSGEKRFVADCGSQNCCVCTTKKENEN